MESYWVNANKAGRKSWIKFAANSAILVPITPKYLKCKETWELKLADYLHEQQCNSAWIE